MSDADEGQRIEVEEECDSRQDARYNVLLNLYHAAGELARLGEELVREGEQLKRETLVELREYCTEFKDET